MPVQDTERQGWILGPGRRQSHLDFDENGLGSTNGRSLFFGIHRSSK